jgi:hypothetical protein
MLSCGFFSAFTWIIVLRCPFTCARCAPLKASLIPLLYSREFVCSQTNFKGRVFMTHPTKSIYKLILQDFLKVSSIAVDDQLYNEQDVLKSMDQIEGINYHQDIHHKGKFCILSYFSLHSFFLLELTLTQVSKFVRTTLVTFSAPPCS